MKKREMYQTLLVLPDITRSNVSYITEFATPLEALPGEELLTRGSTTQIEVERIVPTAEQIFPYFWIWGDEVRDTTDCLQSEPEISDVQQLAEIKAGSLFKVSWETSSEFITDLRNCRAVILRAAASEEGWEFQVRSENRRGFNEFQEAFNQNGIPTQIKKVQQKPRINEASLPSVTERQRKTLIAAYQDGYFEDPRQTTQKELARNFDISARAVSDRLRRGMKNLIVDEILSAEI